MIPQSLNKEYANEDLTEVSKDKFDQMRYDRQQVSFTDFLTVYFIKICQSGTWREIR